MNEAEYFYSMFNEMLLEYRNRQQKEKDDEMTVDEMLNSIEKL